MFRRMLTKWRHLQSVFACVFQHYHDRAEVGIWYNNDTLSHLQPAPPPGGKDRHRWKLKHNSPGPVGLLLQSLHHASSAIDVHQLTIHSTNYIPLKKMEVPWQHLKTVVSRIGIRARNMFASTARTTLKHQGPVCKTVYHAALSKATKHEQRQLAMETHRRVIHHIGTLGVLTPEALATYARHDEIKCELCGATDGSYSHMIFNCSHHRMVAERRKLAQLGDVYHVIDQHWNSLPDTLRHGLPPEMCVRHDTPFWTAQQGPHLSSIADSEQQAKCGVCTHNLSQTRVDFLGQFQDERAIQSIRKSSSYKATYR